MEQNYSINEILLAADEIRNIKKKKVRSSLTRLQPVASTASRERTHLEALISREALVRARRAALPACTTSSLLQILEHFLELMYWAVQSTATLHLPCRWCLIRLLVHLRRWAAMVQLWGLPHERAHEDVRLLILVFRTVGMELEQ